MAYRREDLAVGEWFHCYTRTIDHSRPFEDKLNTERFLEALYLANQSSPMPVMSHLYKKNSHDDNFTLERDKPLIAIGAYVIMPTHYHLLATPLAENGLSEFFHKVGTGFTRFYNDKQERVGNLFVKPFRSKHVSSDGYFGRVASYIHLNPVELFEPEWKNGRVRDFLRLEKNIRNYASSSLFDYEKIKTRTQTNILDKEARSLVETYRIPLRESLTYAHEYYRSLELDMKLGGDAS